MVTLNKAILRGHLTVNIPVLIILFGLPFLFSYLETKKVILLYQKNILIPSSFILAWLYWSFVIVKWKLWAYKNVKELDELKLLAVKQGLIWQDGSFFEKTEIKTKSEKQKLLNYENDFYNSIDFELKDRRIIVFFSKRKTFLSTLLSILFLLFGLFLIVKSNESITVHVFGIICCTIFGLFCLIDIKNFLNRKPQIVISKNGIELNNGKVYKWNEIKNEKIITESTLKYLTFEHLFGSEKILLNDLDTNEIQIEKLIIMYGKTK